MELSKDQIIDTCMGGLEKMCNFKFKLYVVEEK